MHIATIGTYSTHDTGPSAVNKGIATGLGNLGHTVTIYGFGDQSTHPHENVSVKSYPRENPSVKQLKSDHAKAVADARADGADIIHDIEHQTPGADVANIQWTLTDIDLIASRCWGSVSSPREFIGDVLLNVSRRKAAANAPITTASSPETQRQVNQYWRIDVDRVVSNGIYEDTLTSPTEQHGPLNVVFPGRISPKKGQARVLNYLSPDSSRYRVDIVGSASNEAYADRLSEWSDRMHGYVSREELNRFYETADVAVVASEHENFAMTAIEAAARGTIVVITDSCGFAQYDWATPSNGIYTVETGAEAAETVEMLAGQSVEDGKQQAYELASGLTWTDIAEEYVELYEEVQ